MSFSPLTWTDVDGNSTALDGSGDFLVTRGPIGLDAPAPTNTIESYVAFDGAALTNRRRDVRRLALPIMVRDSVRVQTSVAELARMLQGPGELQWADGTNTRYLRNVIYEDGLGGDLSRPSTRKWRQVVVSLVALDPWWYGPDESSSLPIATATAFSAAVAFSAVLPFDGGSSATVANNGDADAYPVITLTGPATGFTVGAGGLDWSLAGALIAGDVLIVDTNPGSRGPRLNGGDVDWALLTEASRLWTLPRGSVSVIVGVTGSSGATAAVLQWAPRHLTP